MSKKPRVKKRDTKKTDALNRVGSLILALSQVYPRQATRYQAARADEQRWGAVPTDHSLFPFSDERRHKAAQLADRYREICQRTQEQISILARLVAVHFPEFDGKLRAVRLYADAWHEKPVDEWATLLTELASIEAAALRTAESIATTEPRKPRGRREVPLDEIRDKLDEVERIGTSNYCEREGIDPSTISKWRKRIKGMKQ